MEYEKRLMKTHLSWWMRTWHMFKSAIDSFMNFNMKRWICGCKSIYQKEPIINAFALFCLQIDIFLNFQMFIDSYDFERELEV